MLSKFYGPTCENQPFSFLKEFLPALFPGFLTGHLDEDAFHFNNSLYFLSPRTHLLKGECAVDDAAEQPLDLLRVRHALEGSPVAHVHIFGSLLYRLRHLLQLLGLRCFFYRGGNLFLPQGLKFLPHRENLVLQVPNFSSSKCDLEHWV